MALAHPIDSMPPPAEIADALHAFGDLGIVYLHVRLRLESDVARGLLDVIACAAIRNPAALKWYLRLEETSRV